MARITDFVNQPRARYAITICSAGWADLHTSQFDGLAEAETAARELSRDHRHATILIHEHNGAEGWKRGTIVVGRYEQGWRITPQARA